MKKQLLQIQRGILLAVFSFLCVISINAQTITNPSFEDGTTLPAPGWTWTGNTGYGWTGINVDATNATNGTHIIGVWNATFGDVQLSQSLTNVPNGYYKVTADLMGSSNSTTSRLTTQRLYATANSITKCMLFGPSSVYSADNLTRLGATETYAFGGYAETLNDNGPFLKLKTFAHVTDGTLTIGIRTNGKSTALGYTFPNLTAGDGHGWFKVDNFTLTDVSTLSTVATLDNITLSVGSLSPAFSSSIITYTATLPVGTTTVTPTPTVTVDGELVSGAGAVDVSSGWGTSTIMVKALDGTTTKTYTINYTTWTAPTLTGSTPASGTTYYMYNVGSNGYLTRGAWFGTCANVSAQPRLNASTQVIKWTATNTTGSMWTFQYNLDGANQTDWFLCATSTSNGDVFTDAYDVAGRTPNRPWTVALTDATNKIYSIQVRSDYGGYVASQYLGSSLGTEDTDEGTCNTVRYNRASGDSYTRWKFVSQADLDLYNARILLDKYMTYAKKKAMAISSYITTYNAGNTANINSAAATLLTALGRTNVTTSITNPSFETNDFTGWTNNGFVTQGNVPGQGWTKAGTYFAERFTDTWNWNLGAGTLTQTVSGLSSGLYELVVSAHAVQQNGGNPLLTGAYITAGSQTTQVAAGQDYSISDITVSGSTLTIGYSLVAPIACNWTGFDNFRLYYYGPLAITLSKTQFAFNGNDNYLSDNLTVTGANLSGAISISAPAGITVNPTSLPSNALNATVTVTYDGTTTVSGNITFTSGTTTANVAVTGAPNTGCFTPLYPSGNIITDPYCNSYLTDGWGTKSINTDPAYVYCGSSSAYIGGGSVDRALNGTNGNAQMLPNTTYRVKAKVWKVSGTVGIGVYGWSGGQSDIFHEVTTAGSWQDVDFTFTSGATLGNRVGNEGIFFNSGTGYIDNWEMYVLDVTIPSGTLTINQNVTVQNGLTIAPGAALILNSGKTLTVKGNLAINSDATGTGVFVNANAPGGLTVGGTSTVQQYITGAGGLTPNTRFWYVSSPLTGATSTAFAVESVSPINKLWSFSETAYGYTQITANATGLTVGRGYVARLGANKTVALTGTALNNGDINITATCTGTTLAKRGYNLVGNPYPSYLDINAAFNSVSTTRLESTVWYRSFNSGTIIMAFDTYNAFSGAGISLGSDAPALTNYIPPMQAFWVRATTDNVSGNLALTNAMRSYQASGNKLRSANADTLCIQKIRLQISNGRGIDQTLIGIYPQAKDSFERYDSHKMFNDNDSIPEIYTFAGKEEVSINGLAPFSGRKEMALGFSTRIPGRFTIKALEMSSLEADAKFFLKDNVLKMEQDLTVNPSYEFTSDVAETSDRFTIVISNMPTTLKQLAGQSVSVYSNANNQIAVKLNGFKGTDGLITVSTALGQRLISTPCNGETTVLNRNLKPGLYLVSVTVNGKVETKKVVLNK